MSAVTKWMEITFMLILAFLILKNAIGFSMSIKSIGSTYVDAVKALQGR